MKQQTGIIIEGLDSVIPRSTGVKMSFRIRVWWTGQASLSSGQLETEHVITATLISEPMHPPLSSLTASRGRVGLQQRAGRMSNKHRKSLRRLKRLPLQCSTPAEFHVMYPYSVCICRMSWSTDLLLVYATIYLWEKCVCVCLHVCCCMIVGGTDGMCMLRQAARKFPWQSMRGHENTAFHCCLWWGYPLLWLAKHVPQISREEKKTSSFLPTDHTTHLTIHLTPIYGHTDPPGVFFWGLITGHCND